MQQPDSQPGAYYVTVRRGERYVRLLGPFQDHPSALALVDDARRVAADLDPRAFFYEFGTARWPEGESKPGVLNARFRA